MTRTDSSNENHRFLAVALSLTAGAVAYYIPKLISERFSPDGPGLFFASISATLLFPALFGYWQPHKAWRWGIYVLAGQLTFMLVTEGLGDMAQFPLGVALYAILFLPAVLFGAVGGYISLQLKRGR